MNEAATAPEDDTPSTSVRPGRTDASSPRARRIARPWKHDEGGAVAGPTLVTSWNFAKFRTCYFTQQSTGQTPAQAGESFCPWHSVHLAVSMT